jgi:hypothetical protein
VLGGEEEEEALEDRLTQAALTLSEVGSQAGAWLVARKDEVGYSIQTLGHSLGVLAEPPPPLSRRRSATRRRPQLDDALLEEVRLQLGIRRDEVCICRHMHLCACTLCTCTLCIRRDEVPHQGLEP